METYTPTYIPDGYTRRGYVKAVAGLHGAVRFNYRPMLPGERNSVRTAIGREKSDKADVLQSGVVAKQIVSWDCSYPDDGPDEAQRGKTVPVTVASVRHLVPALYDRLFMIVGGMDASDPEPDAPPAEQASYADLLLQGGEADDPIGDVELAAQQKN